MSNIIIIIIIIIIIDRLIDMISEVVQAHCASGTRYKVSVTSVVVVRKSVRRDMIMSSARHRTMQR